MEQHLQRCSFICAKTGVHHTGNEKESSIEGMSSVSLTEPEKHRENKRSFIAKKINI